MSRYHVWRPQGTRQLPEYPVQVRAEDGTVVWEQPYPTWEECMRWRRRSRRRRFRPGKTAAPSTSAAGDAAR